MTSVLRQQLVPEGPSKPKADDFSDYCRENSGRDQRTNIKVMRSGTKNRSPNQGRLSGHRNTDAFESDECSYDPDTVCCYKLSHSVTQAAFLGWLAGKK